MEKFSESPRGDLSLWIITGGTDGEHFYCVWLQQKCIKFEITSHSSRIAYFLFMLNSLKHSTVCNYHFSINLINYTEKCLFIRVLDECSQREFSTLCSFTTLIE